MCRRMPLSNRTRHRLYWTSTACVTFALTLGGLADVLHHPIADRTMTHLGFPPYFQVVIGVWKLLGVMALLAPGLPLLKEWAYAGMFFDVSGAAIAHAVSGDHVELLPPLAVAALLSLSWALRPPGRRYAQLNERAHAAATVHENQPLGNLEP
jgi:hypothetical protein